MNEFGHDVGLGIW